MITSENTPTYNIQIEQILFKYLAIYVHIYIYIYIYIYVTTTSDENRDHGFEREQSWRYIKELGERKRKG
jgi:hypothetical protein